MTTASNIIDTAKDILARRYGRHFRADGETLHDVAAEPCIQRPPRLAEPVKGSIHGQEPPARPLAFTGSRGAPGQPKAYADYVAGALIDIDGPIDDQDQSHAAQSRNLSEAFDAPLHDLLHKIDLLKRIDFGPETKVEAGAVVRFGDRYYVIGVATGRFSCDGQPFMGISTQAPICAELEDRRAGERFTFNGHEHLIDEVA